MVNLLSERSKPGSKAMKPELHNNVMSLLPPCVSGALRRSNISAWAGWLPIPLSLPAPQTLPCSRFPVCVPSVPLFTLEGQLENTEWTGMDTVSVSPLRTTSKLSLSRSLSLLCRLCFRWIPYRPVDCTILIGSLPTGHRRQFNNSFWSTLDWVLN